MMTCLDPFYGITKFGSLVAKILNRIIVLAELAAIFYFAWLEYIYRYHSYWIYVVYFPLAVFAASFANRTIKNLWNMFLVVLHGTNEQEELHRIRQKSLVKDAARQARRDCRRMQKAEEKRQRIMLQQQAEQLKLERRNLTLLPDRKETDPLAIYAEAAAKAQTVAEIPKPQNKQELLIHDERAIRLMQLERIRLQDQEAQRKKELKNLQK